MSMKKQSPAIFEQIRAELGAWDFPSVAEAAGITQQTLHNWHRGTVTCPHLRTLMAVAEVLGYDVQLTRRRAHLRSVA